MREGKKKTRELRELREQENSKLIPNSPHYTLLPTPCSLLLSY
ncbi:hypothetical protein [Scytonema millei]|nr:hypothetical protein [Scytonema millei]